jgi:hypothetical protein
MFLILALGFVFSFSPFVNAADYQLIGREIFPGVDRGDRVVGALFIGKVFDVDSWTELGKFKIILDNDGNNVETCRGITELLRFKLIMSFNNGSRLVLVGPTSETFAYWDWDDLDCPDGNCILTDYSYYIDLFDPLEPNPIECDDNTISNPDLSFIAEVEEFGVKRQWFGSYGVKFKKGLISGYLVHTPIVSPAIFGIVQQTD